MPRQYVIILDNLSSRKSPLATQALRDIGCWFLPVPPYSEIIRAFARTNGVYPLKFARLKALLR